MHACPKCIYIYIYTCIHTYITNIHAHIYMHSYNTYIHRHACMHARIHRTTPHHNRHLHIYMHICTHACIHSGHEYMHACPYILAPRTCINDMHQIFFHQVTYRYVHYIHTHAYMNTHRHTCIRTNIYLHNLHTCTHEPLTYLHACINACTLARITPHHVISHHVAYVHTLHAYVHASMYKSMHTCMT